ncbi:unnamed protein product [Mytilus coruscus]|uniref:B box-type domain-containing protein n=1 Tax=Mytilus coruscus TaxID=42192 RepID=A0A6J8A4Y5_MYTCO|nr:unnamed protein product [Mytilus coruscus]
MADFKLDTGETPVEDIQPTSNNYCGPCETRLVTTAPQYWCNFCEEGLCAECFEHHKAIKASRSHVTVEFSKFMKLKPFISTIDTECRIHDLPFELYCPNHEATCCSYCATLDHSTCFGLKSLPNVVASFRESACLNYLDRRFDVLVNNIEKVIENRVRNKEKISNQCKKSRSDIQILRKEINKHLDNLESQLATKSDKIIEDENEKLENILQRLEEKKRNVNDLKKNFSELKIGGTNLQVFISSRQIDTSISEVNESLNSEMTEENMSELSLEFIMNPDLEETINQLLDVHLEREKSTVLLDLSTKLSCQIILEDVTKVTAVHVNSFEKSAFQKTSNITCITSLHPGGKIAVADYDSSSISVFNLDGSIVKNVQFSSRLFGVTYVDEYRLAVSFPSTESIKIIETTEYTELKEIKLKKPCWGIHCVNDLIFVAIRSTEILVIDLSGNTVNTFHTNQNNLIYVHALKNLHFRSQFDEGCVCSYDSTGSKLWQFSNDTTKGARNMCADTNGAMDCDVCPPPGIGLCVELGGCPIGKLLCFNGCGHTCMTPVKGTLSMQHQDFLRQKSDVCTDGSKEIEASILAIALCNKMCNTQE